MIQVSTLHFGIYLEYLTKSVKAHRSSMKTCILLMVWLICVCIKTHAQHSRGVLIAVEAMGENTPTKPGDVSLETKSPLTPISANYTQLPAPNYDQAYFIQKSRIQRLNGMALLTGVSVMSLLGIRSMMDISNCSYPGSKNSLQVNMFETNYNSRLALTGLVMIVGSIPYFLNALKNRKPVGLKLACQKTFVGTNKKVCRKVTGVTFAIPIGK